MIFIELVVSCSDAPIVFDLVEEAFDQISLAIQDDFRRDRSANFDNQYLNHIDRVLIISHGLGKSQDIKAQSAAEGSIETSK